MASLSRFIPIIESSSFTSSSSLNDDNSFDGNQETVFHNYKKWVQQMTNLLSSQMLTLLSQPVTRRHLKRNREGSHQQIWKDYFAENCTYPADYFHRRYRMRRELFLRILKDVKAYDEYFIQKKDCCGRLG